MSINTDEGAFVGCGRAVSLSGEPDSLTLSAEAEDATSYFWYIDDSGEDYDGSGYFSAPSSETTSLYGTAPGKAGVNVQVACDGGSGQAEADITIIEITDLTDDVPEDYYEEIDVTDEGFYVFEFTDEGGSLVSVQVAPTTDAANPYQWNTDFWGTVDHESGDTQLNFTRLGAYLVKVIRDSGSLDLSEEIVQLLFGAAAASRGPHKTGKTFAVSPPSDQLMLVSTSTNDTNGFLTNARANLEDTTPMSTVAGVISSISDAFFANEELPISVDIVDHGAEAVQSMGSGDTSVPGAEIDDSTTPADLAAFIAGCTSMVTVCTFYGCNVAQGDGDAWLQYIATQAGITMAGFTGSVYTFPGGWIVSDDGNKVVKTP